MRAPHYFRRGFPSLRHLEATGGFGKRSIQSSPVQIAPARFTLFLGNPGKKGMGHIQVAKENKCTGRRSYVLLNGVHIYYAFIS